MANDKFNITDPKPNDILIYNQIQDKFINVEPSLSLFGATNMVTDGLSIGGGAPVFNDITGSGTIRFKSLTGSNGISINNLGSNLEINFDGEAQTLGGLDSDSYVQVSNDLSDVNAVNARQNLNVYSIQQAHDTFLEANASNIPDDDNEYDLGSNGRRFANVFAATFHGLATESIVTNGLKRGSAQDGDVLVWRNSSNNWVPEQPQTNRLNTLTDVDTTNIQHESILLYNGILSRWETVPSGAIGGGSGGGSGDVTNAENIGSGIGTYLTKVGGILQFRSISGGNNVNVSTNFNNEEIIIDVDVPDTTDDLTEGSNNLYYTDTRVQTYISTNVSFQDLNNVTTTPPTTGQAPVWDGTEWVFQPVAGSINDTDDVPEGSNNLYFTESRAFDSVVNFINDPGQGIELGDLSDTNITNQNGSYLFNDSGTWIEKQVTVSDIQDIDTTSIQNGDVLVYDSSTQTFVRGTLPQTLEDLSETATVLYFNETNFDNFFNQKSTDDLAETVDRKYLNTSNLIDELENTSVGHHSDVDISGINNNNVLIWDSSEGKFVPADSESLNVSVDLGIGELNNVNESSITNAQDNYVIQYNQSNSEFEARELQINVEDLSDVIINSIDDGHGLVYQSGDFVNVPMVPYNDSVTANNNYVLSYDDSTNSYRAVDVNTLVDLGITDLNDVDFSSPNNDDILIYNTSTNQVELKSVSDLSNVSNQGDVNLSGLQENDVLVWDGTEFVNKEMKLFQTGQANDKDILIFSDSNDEFIIQNIYDALDIDYSAPNNNDVFKYNASENKFEITQINLGDLGDVDTTGVQNDYIVYWNGTNFATKESTATVNSINDLGDVDTTGILVDQVLVWDGSEFIPGSISSVENIEDLNNVDINFGTISSGDVLTWDGSQFVANPQTGSGSGASELNELTDVDIDSPAVDDFLVYNGTQFVNQQVNIVESIDDLNDVDDTDKAEGRILVNRSGVLQYEDIPTGGGGSGAEQLSELSDVDSSLAPNDGDILIYDAVESEFKAQALVVDDINDISNVDITGIQDGQGLVWDNGTFVSFDPVTELNNLSDVEISGTPVSGQVLAWDGDNFSLTALSTGAQELDELSDVSIGTLNVGDILRYDGTEFVNEELDLSTLDIFEFDNIQDGQFIVYNNTTSKFENQNVNLVENIDDLNDVDDTDKAEGRILVNRSGIMQYEDLPSTGSESLNDLTDVEIDGPVVGEALVYDGTNFVNQSIPSVENINDLNDVDTTGIEDGQILSYNESTGNFEPINMSGSVDELNDIGDVDTDGAQVGDVLTYNGTEWVPQESTGGSGGTASNWERVELMYDPGSGADGTMLGGVQNIQFETPNVTANIIDGNNCILEFTFSNKSFPPISIYVYGFNYNAQQWIMRSGVNLSTTKVVIDQGSQNNPSLFNGSFTETIRISLDKTETNAQGDDGFTVGSRAVIMFGFGE